jgi:DNA-binding transcriptional ArsR family regulator
MVVNLEKRLLVFNENKLLILQSLYNCPNTICGCDLVSKLAIPKNLLSYHIKQLTELGLIEEAKCGRKKQYKIRASASDKVYKILDVTELI